MNIHTRNFKQGSYSSLYYVCYIIYGRLHQLFPIMVIAKVLNKIKYSYLCIQRKNT